ncbi:transposase [Candidatus Daviesbacteria bacterium]|nr:transposase [Candidatus Daviesbacteria bacterium]
MPGRKTPLVIGEIYHVFNRGINRQPTFITKGDYLRAQVSINFYRFLRPPTSLSKFLKLDNDRQEDMWKLLQQTKRSVEILSYCLMPNHFHFLLKQIEENGISKFMGNLQNSYTKYFNTKNDRDGSLFLDQFKAVRVETDEQLIHLTRYIHLNPHTGYVIKSLEELGKYPWSSFPDFLKEEGQFVDVNFALSFFGSSEKYKKFVFDQADYQRQLKEIEYLILEHP